MKSSTQFFGKYTLLEKLASGGMAEIFLARGTGAKGIGKLVAIKRILPQFSDSQDYKDMFTSEAKIAVNLSHSNIVSIYEFGIEKKQLYLVMDYVEGRNLRQMLNKMKEKSKSFSMEQVVYIIKEAASGLDHAHRCLDGTTGESLNIVHRDISPQNVMISFEGEVKIVDFGIAKAEVTEEATADGTLKGKFGYMSPEQAEGRGINLRTDIFSLGIILWESLARERLFLANNEISTLRKIRRCQIPSLKRVNPNIHPELERIVKKALVKDQHLRYQDSAALHRDLSRFLNRRYPDFSSHDFSTFIRSLYSDEIVSARKRLIEYAKIPDPPAPSASEVTSTEGLDESFLSISEDHLIDENQSLGAGGHGKTTSRITLSEPHENLLGRESGLSGGNQEGRASFEFSEDDMDEGEAKSILPSPSDLSQPDMSPLYNTTTTYTGSMPNSKNKSFSNSRDLSVSLVMRRKQKKHHVAVILVLAMTVCGLAYMTDLHKKVLSPENKAQIISQIQQGIPRAPSSPPSLPPSQGAASGPGSTRSVSSTSHRPHQQGGLNQGRGSNQAVGATSSAGVNSQSGSRKIKINVNSNPANAEIWVNGKVVGESTPAIIYVTQNKPIHIKLKKENHITYTKKNLIFSKAGQGFMATLQRAHVGYLNIDVRPPHPAVKIYLDGELLKGEELPIRRYAVPAKTIVVEARNPVLKTYSKQRILLRKGEKKYVVLKLKKKFR